MKPQIESSTMDSIIKEFLEQPREKKFTEIDRIALTDLLLQYERFKSQRLIEEIDGVMLRQMQKEEEANVFDFSAAAVKRKMRRARRVLESEATRSPKVARPTAFLPHDSNSSSAFSKVVGPVTDSKAPPAASKVDGAAPSPFLPLASSSNASSTMPKAAGAMSPAFLSQVIDLDTSLTAAPAFLQEQPQVTDSKAPPATSKVDGPASPALPAFLLQEQPQVTDSKATSAASKDVGPASPVLPEFLQKPPQVTDSKASSAKSKAVGSKPQIMPQVMTLPQHMMPTGETSVMAMEGLSTLETILQSFKKEETCPVCGVFSAEKEAVRQHIIHKCRLRQLNGTFTCPKCLNSQTMLKGNFGCHVLKCKGLKKKKH